MPTTNPIPSTDPSDLLFNAGKLDEVVSGTSAYYTDRLGVNRRTIDGINASADIVLAGLGYAPPVVYASGISLTLATQTVEYSGEVYAPKVADLPFTTSGTFETAKFRLIQGVASADLPAIVGQDLQDYAALRAYTGLASRIYITGPLVTAKPAGIAGQFQHDPTDTTSLEDGGTIIVGADGRRWKRDYSGPASVGWFGAVGGGGAFDDTLAIQKAIDSGISKLFYPDGHYLVDELKLRSFQTHISSEGGARIITNGIGYTWLSTTQYVTFDGLGFAGTGKAIYNADPSFYATGFKFRNCQFGNSLQECIYGTMLLSLIENNLFGANLGTLGLQNRHVYLKGTVAGGLAINQNTIKNNRFFRANGSGTSAVYVEFGNGNLLEHNTFEECYVTPLILDRAGLTTLTNNWFEGNAVANQVECRNTVVGATFYKTKVSAKDNSFLLLNAACLRVFEMDSNSVVVDLGGNNFLTTQTPHISRQNSIVNAGITRWGANTFDGTWVKNTVNKLTNGDATNGTTGWTTAFATLAAITGGGPTGGNYFELTATTGSSQRMEQVVTNLVVGKKYRAEFWTKSGTSGNEAWLWETIPDYTRNANGTTTAAWVKSSLDFIALETFATFRLNKNTSTLGSMLFGDITVTEIIE